MRSYSDNAMMSKVRALYGRRLTGEDYDQLLHKKSVAEVTGYLKNETGYRDLLAEVHEELIHRGQLEQLLERRVLDTYQKLLKYASSDRLYRCLYLARAEIGQLLTVIRLLNSGGMDRYILSLPGYLARHMSFDLFSLAKVRGFDDLLELLEGCVYYRILARYRPEKPGGAIDIAACETALLTHYYRQAIEVVETYQTGDAKRDLLKMLHTMVELNNLRIMFRMKRYFRSTPEEIRQRLLPVPGVLSGRIREQLLLSDDFEAFTAQIQALRLTRRFPVRWEDSAEHVHQQTEQVRQKLGQKIFRFSTQPVVVVVSYMSLLEIEINNLTNIIEGIRYHIAPEEIRRLLAV